MSSLKRKAEWIENVTPTSLNFTPHQPPDSDSSSSVSSPFSSSSSSSFSFSDWRWIASDLLQLTCSYLHDSYDLISLRCVCRSYSKSTNGPRSWINSHHNWIESYSSGSGNSMINTRKSSTSSASSSTSATHYNDPSFKFLQVSTNQLIQQISVLKYLRHITFTTSSYPLPHISKSKHSNQTWPTDYASYFTSTNLPYLTSISFIDCDFIIPFHLHLNKLQTLNEINLIRQIGISVDWITRFESIPNLKRLSLIDCDSLTTEHIVALPLSLTSLAIRTTQTTVLTNSLADAALTFITLMSELQCLELLDEVTAEQLTTLSSASAVKLEVLRIRVRGEDTGSINALVKCIGEGKFPALKELDLVGLKISMDQYKNLVDAILKRQRKAVCTEKEPQDEEEKANVWMSSTSSPTTSSSSSTSLPSTSPHIPSIPLRLLHSYSFGFSISPPVSSHSISIPDWLSHDVFLMMYAFEYVRERLGTQLYEFFDENEEMVDPISISSELVEVEQKIRNKETQRDRPEVIQQKKKQVQQFKSPVAERRELVNEMRTALSSADWPPIHRELRKFAKEDMSIGSSSHETQPNMLRCPFLTCHAVCETLQVSNHRGICYRIQHL